MIWDEEIASSPFLKEGFLAMIKESFASQIQCDVIALL
jgi:hypothetical protein